MKSDLAFHDTRAKALSAARGGLGKTLELLLNEFVQAKLVQGDKRVLKAALVLVRRRRWFDRIQEWSLHS